MNKVLVLLFAFISVSAMAQDEGIGSIGTDRPAQSETPTVVPKKYLQFEVGAQYQRGIEYQNAISSTYRYDDSQIPNMLFKYGLVKNLELRLSANYMEYTSVSTINGKEYSVSDNALTDPEIGLKYAILRESETGINLSASLHGSFHIWADENYKSEEIMPRLRFTAGKSLTSNWYVLAGGELQVSEEYDRGLYIFQTGYTFTGKLTALIEFYGYRDSEYQNALNGALVYLINDNNQVDISTGMGLDDKLYDYYIGIGYSFRLSATASK